MSSNPPIPRISISVNDEFNNESTAASSMNIDDMTMANCSVPVNGSLLDIPGQSQPPSVQGSPRSSIAPSVAPSDISVLESEDEEVFLGRNKRVCITIMDPDVSGFPMIHLDPDVDDDEDDDEDNPSSPSGQLPDEISGDAHGEVIDDADQIDDDEDDEATAVTVETFKFVKVREPKKKVINKLLFGRGGTQKQNYFRFPENICALFDRDTDTSGPSNIFDVYGLERYRTGPRPAFGSAISVDNDPTAPNRRASGMIDSALLSRGSIAPRVTSTRSSIMSPRASTMNKSSLSTPIASASGSALAKSKAAEGSAIVAEVQAREQQYRAIAGEAAPYSIMNGLQRESDACAWWETEEAKRQVMHAAGELPHVFDEYVLVHLRCANLLNIKRMGQDFTPFVCLQRERHVQDGPSVWDTIGTTETNPVLLLGRRQREEHRRALAQFLSVPPSNISDSMLETSPDFAPLLLPRSYLTDGDADRYLRILVQHQDDTKSRTSGAALVSVGRLRALANISRKTGKRHGGDGLWMSEHEYLMQPLVNAREGLDEAASKGHTLAKVYISVRQPLLDVTSAATLTPMYQPMPLMLKRSHVYLNFATTGPVQGIKNAGKKRMMSAAYLVFHTFCKENVRRAEFDDYTDADIERLRRAHHNAPRQPNPNGDGSFSIVSHPAGTAGAPPTGSTALLGPDGSLWTQKYQQVSVYSTTVRHTTGSMNWSFMIPIAQLTGGFCDFDQQIKISMIDALTAPAGRRETAFTITTLRELLLQGTHPWVMYRRQRGMGSHTVAAHVETVYRSAPAVGRQKSIVDGTQLEYATGADAHTKDMARRASMEPNPNLGRRGSAEPFTDRRGSNDPRVASPNGVRRASMEPNGMSSPRRGSLEPNGVSSPRRGSLEPNGVSSPRRGSLEPPTAGSPAPQTPTVNGTPSRMGRRASGLPGLLPSYTSPIASPTAVQSAGTIPRPSSANSVALRRPGSGNIVSPVVSPRRGSQGSTGSGGERERERERERDSTLPARGKHGFPTSRGGYLFTTSCSATLDQLLESRALRPDDRKERLHRCGALVVESARLLLHASDIEDAALRHMEMLQQAARTCCPRSAHALSAEPTVSISTNDGELTVATTTTAASNDSDSPDVPPCPRWWGRAAEVCILESLAASRVAHRSMQGKAGNGGEVASAIDIYRSLRLNKRRDVALGTFTPPIAHAFLAYMSATQHPEDDGVESIPSRPASALASPINASTIVQNGGNRTAGGASVTPGVLEVAGLVPTNLMESHAQTQREEDAGFVALHDTFETWVNQRKYEQYLSWEIRCADVDEKGFYQLEVYVLRAGQYELYKVSPQVAAKRSGSIWSCTFPPLVLRAMGLVQNHRDLRSVAEPPPPPEDPRIAKLLRARTRVRVQRKAELLSNGVDVRDIDPWAAPPEDWVQRIRVALTLGEPLPPCALDELDQPIDLDAEPDILAPEAFAMLSSQNQAVVATGEHQFAACNSVIFAVAKLPQHLFQNPRKIVQFGAGYVGEMGPADSYKHTARLEVPLVVFPADLSKDAFADEAWREPQCGRPGTIAGVNARTVHVQSGVEHVGLTEVLFENVREEVALQRQAAVDRVRAAKQRLLSDLESNEPLEGVARSEWRRKKQEYLFSRKVQRKDASDDAEEEAVKVGVALPMIIQEGQKPFLSRAALEVRQVTLATHKQVLEEKDLEKAAKATKKFFRLIKSRPQQADEDPYDGYYA